MDKPEYYTKKPVRIEAIQFTLDNLIEVQNFVGVTHDGNTLGFRMSKPIVSARNDDGTVAKVWDKLHSTWVGVKIGQWIIKGVQGEFYPCDTAVFESTYDKAES